MTALGPTVTRRRETVAVLMGGTSVERPVSLASGSAVASALTVAGYAVQRIDVGADVIAVIAALRPPPDAVFNALHGKGGEDGAIQGLLDLLRIPYTHSGVLASALAMDKPTAKRLFAAAGLRCPDGVVVTGDELRAGDPLARPYVVKPTDEGSSFGVRIVRPGDNAGFDDCGDGPFLAERYIPGRELTVGVYDGDGGAHAMGVIEITHSGAFFDYQSKYGEGQSNHLIPAPIHATAFTEACAMAVAAHRTLGCRGISRADFRYDDTAGEPGVLYLLEVNTQPGMTALSLVPDLAAQAMAVPFPALCSWLVEHARCD